MDAGTKTVLGIAVVLVIVLLGLILFQTGNGGINGNVTNEGKSEVITFGFVEPLTGDVSSIGQQNKVAVEMAVDEINEAGGINGKMIKVIYEDGKCNAKEAANAGNKLINIDQVKYIIGGGCSGETLSIAPLAEQKRVVMISPISSSPDVTNAGEYIFRDYPTDNDAGRILARKMFNDEGHRKVALLWSLNDYSEGYSRVFNEEFTKLGGEVVLKESFIQGTSDLRSVISKVKASDSDSVVIIEYTAGLTAFFKQKQELGLDLPIYASDTMSDPEIVNAVGNTADGTKYVLAEDSYSEEFKDKLRARAGSDSVQVGSPQAYDAVYIFAKAIEAAGDDSTKVKDWLYKMPAYDGESGRVEFDENGDLQNPGFVIWEIRNAKPVLLG